MKKYKGVGYTGSQWIIFCILGLTNILINMLYSMQASIFPLEALKRNATATEFGLVFGSYELTQLIMYPIVGNFAPKIGISCVFNSGLFVGGISTILFGFLQFVNNRWLFIILALFLRVIESIGTCAVGVTIYTIIATKFPESMASTMGAMECIVGFAFSVGPFVGSALFQVGGFILPFNVIGSSLICIGGIVYCVLHNIDGQMNQTSKDSDYRINLGIFSLLKNVPTIYLYMFIVIVAGINLGFILALLEVHLEQFELKPIYNGLAFLLFGLTYAVSSPIFSWLCGFIKIPELVPLTGTILYITGFTLVGPASFIPLNPSLGLTLGGVALIGCASGCIGSSGFILSIMAAENSGLSESSQVSSQISSIWLFSFSFGSFIGPIIAGILYDFISFPLASLSMIGLDLVQIIFLLIVIVVWKRKTKTCFTLIKSTNKNDESLPLIKSNKIEIKNNDLFLRI